MVRSRRRQSNEDAPLEKIVEKFIATKTTCEVDEADRMRVKMQHSASTTQNRRNRLALRLAKTSKPCSIEQGRSLRKGQNRIPAIQCVHQRQRSNRWRRRRAIKEVKRSTPAEKRWFIVIDVSSYVHDQIASLTTSTEEKVTKKRVCFASRVMFKHTWKRDGK